MRRLLPGARAIIPAILFVAALIVVAPFPARGHEPASRVETRQGRQYRLEISIYDEQPYVRRPVRFTIRALLEGAPLPCGAVAARGRPFVETRAVPTRAVRLRRDEDGTGRCAGAVLLPVQGLWDLEVRIEDGTAGETFRVPLNVAAPHAMPKWIAWMIGLSPLGGMAMFAWSQRGYLRRLRAEVS